MIEVIGLIVLGVIWLLIASIQDLKKREIANWLSFSLIIFIIGFRFFFSLFSGNFGFFYQGLIALGIFFTLSNLLYFGRMFAGGDSKLFVALGPIIAFYSSFHENLGIFFIFIFIFLFTGALYGLIATGFLAIKNSKKFKKEFFKQFKKNKKLILSILCLAIIMGIFSFFESSLIFFSILIFLVPYLFLVAKSVDESCMVKKISAKDLTEGDWLYRDVKIGSKKIKANWNGLTKKDIRLLKKNNKKVFIRYGIPYIPIFLISFMVLVVLEFLI